MMSIPEYQCIGEKFKSVRPYLHIAQLHKLFEIFLMLQNSTAGTPFPDFDAISASLMDVDTEITFVDLACHIMNTISIRISPNLDGSVSLAKREIVTPMQIDRIDTAHLLRMT
tara:strand:+ start:140 stop:478 length:339 start_codon:yes stop_codon:yes gene_type:complete